MGLGSDPDLPPLFTICKSEASHTHIPSLLCGNKCQGFGTPPTSSMKSLLIPAAHLISPSSESLTLISAFHLVITPLCPVISCDEPLSRIIM